MLFIAVPAAVLSIIAIKSRRPLIHANPISQLAKKSGLNNGQYSHASSTHETSYGTFSANPSNCRAKEQQAAYQAFYSNKYHRQNRFDPRLSLAFFGVGYLLSYFGDKTYQYLKD